MAYKSINYERWNHQKKKMLAGKSINCERQVEQTKKRIDVYFTGLHAYLILLKVANLHKCLCSKQNMVKKQIQPESNGDK